MDKARTLVVIPAYNEESTIRGRNRAMKFARRVVVNDASKGPHGRDRRRHPA